MVAGVAAGVGAWGHRHRRGLWVGALVVAVLALVAFLVRAPVNDAWLAHRACDGDVSGDDLDTIRTGAHLEDHQRFHNRELGQYRCLLTNTEDKVVVSVEAYTRPADQRLELSRVGKEGQPQRVLPGGLPGFASDNGDIHLMPRCPRLGEDFDGGSRRMLATTWAPLAEGRPEAAALLRTAVKMTNKASEKLGCGARALPAPKEGAAAGKGREITRAAAGETACAALAGKLWPEPGAKARGGSARGERAARGVEVPGAKVLDAVRAHAPIGRCTLTMAADSSTEAESRQPVVELTSWYGDWGGGTEERGAGSRSYGLRADGSRTAHTNESSAWATARCDGGHAGFAARWGSTYGDSARAVERVRPRTKGDQAAALRALVAEFARDQVEREGCTGLELPN